MQLHISGQQMEVTPALRDYVTAKLERIVRHFEHVIDVNVVLGVEKLLHKAEATVTIAQKVVHADASAADMYAAIDALVDKLDTQVRKHKDKLTDHQRGATREARAVHGA